MRSGPALPIARNTVLLSAAMAANSAMVQLSAALAPLWLAAGGFELVGLALVAAVRHDPKEIATFLQHGPADRRRERRRSALPEVHKRLPEEDAMHPHVAMIPADPKAAR